MKRKITHNVIKIQDAKAYLRKEQLEQLDMMLLQISNGRRLDNKKPVNRYIIVNEDESYYDDVAEVLRRNGDWDEEPNFFKRIRSVFLDPRFWLEIALSFAVIFGFSLMLMHRFGW